MDKRALLEEQIDVKHLLPRMNFAAIGEEPSYP
jgi:hypothetical protein